MTKTYKRTTCDMMGCDRPKFNVGKVSLGTCHIHHLDLPFDARREWLMAEVGSGEQDAAWSKIMDFHVNRGNACQHRKFRNDGDTPADSDSRCMICFPKKR